MVFVKTWDESVPAGSEAILTGDDRIREFKYAARERLAVDHNFKATEGADANIGRHNQVSLIDQVTDIAAVSGATCFYGKTIAGKIEVFLILSDSTIVQLTTNGKLNGAVFAALANIPSAAGVIPIANLATGTPDGTKFVRDDGTLAVALQTMPAGSFIQHQYASTASVITTSSVIANDNSKPQSNEGVEVITKAITPANASNRLLIRGLVNLCGSTSGDKLVVALFQDSGTDAIAVAEIYASTAQALYPIPIQFEMAAGTTSATTFKLRAGGSDNNPHTINGENGSSVYDGTLFSSLHIAEIKV